VVGLVVTPSYTPGVGPANIELISMMSAVSSPLLQSINSAWKSNDEYDSNDNYHINNTHKKGNNSSSYNDNNSDNDTDHYHNNDNSSPKRDLSAILPPLEGSIDPLELNVFNFTRDRDENNRRNKVYICIRICIYEYLYIHEYIDMYICIHI
jgi:hypothetical protein